MSDDLELTADDIAFGYVTGALPDGVGPQLPTGTSGSRPSLTPTAALAAALRPALERPPCVIGFSGGRDSSLLLAVAVDEARRAGLPLPVPTTLEFDSEGTSERHWQELVLTHLGIDDWIHLPQGTELDLLGPVACKGLRRHGVLYPGNAHMIVPLARVARGGSVITGFAGDEVLGSWPFQDIAAVLAGRRAPHPPDLRRALVWAAPAQMRVGRYARGRRWVQLPWLRSPHAARAAQRIATEMAGSPRTWTGRMRWLARRRIWALSAHATALLAADHEAIVHAPLLDPGFLAALAAAGGRLGLGDRTEAMRAIAGHLLPAATIERTAKAEFSESYFGAHTKRFAARWDGVSGIDPAVVDAQALREEWLSDHPHGLSAALLQAAWLVSRAAPSTEPVGSARTGDGGD